MDYFAESEIMNKMRKKSVPNTPRETEVSNKTMIIDISLVGFQVLTAASMKFRVFWDVAPCSHAEVDRRFRGAYCLNHRLDDDGSSGM
jgi:hypothetical protein